MRVITLLALLMFYSSVYANKTTTNFQMTDTVFSTITHAAKIKAMAKLSLFEIAYMLHKPSNQLRPEVIQKILASLTCADSYDIEHNHILTIIDYSLPSNKKRLWIFDSKEKRLLFHTHVSHGIRSGAGLSQYFSNKNNSKATSIGVYKTAEAYHGRHGLSLKLHGMDKGFNDNAYGRFIVMHGGWYVEKEFIEKYGRAGRSWGCPALPTKLTKPIINTIKDGAFFVAYYPSERWIEHSKFLTCRTVKKLKPQLHNRQIADSPYQDNRSPIVFADLNNNHKREENEPVLTISADTYQQTFTSNPPLKRMLRRQITKKEYIALNMAEIKNIINNDNTASEPHHLLEKVKFVIPEVKNVRGYYATEMKIIQLGTIKKIQPHSEKNKLLTIKFNNRSSINILSTESFIRWLGL